MRAILEKEEKRVKKLSETGSSGEEFGQEEGGRGADGQTGRVIGRCIPWD